MKKKVVLLAMFVCSLAALLAVSAFAADIVESGNCGKYWDNVTYTLDSDGLLTISGTGEMGNYSYNAGPWYYGREKIKKVVIEVGVTNIGSYAFGHGESLTSIEIPNSVMSIGYGAFEDCNSLTSIEIPNSVTSIGDSAFSGCSSLTSIEIPGSVTSIGDRAFYCCRSLTRVGFQNGVVNIGNYAFYSCSNLKKIYYTGDAPSQMGSNAFDSGVTIYYMVNSAGWTSPTWTAPNGTAYNTVEFNPHEIIDSGNCGKDGSNLTYKLEADGTLTISGVGEMSGKYTAPWYSSHSDIEKVVIEEGVTSIGDYAFYDCKSLTCAEIPNSVTSIGNFAFTWCKSLTSIEIPNSVTSIGNSTFSGCYNLTSVEISNSITSIGDAAFHLCDRLTNIEIPNGVTSIGDAAFSSCHSLASIEIPNSVTSIGDGAFSGCSKLTKIVVSGDNPNYSNDEYGVLFNKEKTELISCPSGLAGTSYIIPNSVTSIGYEAFFYCSNLTSIEIPDSVTSIGDRTFYLCSKLKSIVIPSSIPSIGDYVFWECSDLTSITVSDSITSIGDYAFSGCRNLTNIDIPSSVTSIGNSAFSGCRNLTSIKIPSSVTSIGGEAFSAANKVYFFSDVPTEIGRDFLKNSATVYYPVGNTSGWTTPKWKAPNGTEYDAHPFDPNDYIIDNVEWSLADGVLTISGSGKMDNYSDGNSPWYNDREEITKVIVEKGITSIGDYAFKGCNSLTSIEIPNSVTNIGSLAFNGCNNLISIEISSSVTSIGNYAFSGCSKLTKIDVSKDNPNYTSDEYGVLFNKEKTELISCPSGLAGTSYIIPNSVTSIGNYAFSSCRSLVSIKIPNGVASIGESAFRDCSSLTSIEIPNSVTSIGNFAFLYCSSLTSIEIPNSVTRIGCSAFVACSSLTSIEIPKSVISIGIGAFNSCSKLTKIDVSEGNPNYSSDEYGVFFNKEKTELISCPGGFTGMSYVIPNSVTSIGRGAFEACSNLTSIEIPNSITRIDEYAFSGCNRLKNVYFGGTAKEWYDIYIFKHENDCLLGATIHYSTPTVKGVTIMATEDTNINDKTVLVVENVASEALPQTAKEAIGEKKHIAYDITLENSGAKVQPNGKVRVELTPPDSYNLENCIVYHIKEDGTLENMNAVIKNGRLCFETDHFSVYMIIDTSEYTIGDTDGDGTISSADAVLLAQHLAGWKTNINLSAADVNGDGKITAKDSVLLAQYLAGWGIKLGK